MRKVSVDTFWNRENRKAVTRWVTLALFLLVDAEMKSRSFPTVHEVMAELEIPDEELAAYILTGAQNILARLPKQQLYEL